MWYWPVIGKLTLGDPVANRGARNFDLEKRKTKGEIILKILFTKNEKRNDIA
jgi:hypothetical protein